MPDLYVRLQHAIADAEHKPGAWAHSPFEMGGIGDPMPQAMTALMRDSAAPRAWGHFPYKRDAWLAVAAVNALPELMTLAQEARRLAGASPELDRALAAVFGPDPTKTEARGLPRTLRDKRLVERGAS